MHPDWNVFDEKYDADIAILVLNENLTFSSNIRQVCMPMDDINIDGVKGTVVGWGVTESGIAEGIPRQTETVALNDSYCYRADSGIARYLVTHILNSIPHPVQIDQRLRICFEVLVGTFVLRDW